MTETPKTVLVSLDGSEFAETALGPAIALAQGVGGRLVIVSVPEIYGIDLAWYADAGMGGAGVAVPIQELMGEARTATTDYLAQISARLASTGVAVETRMGELEPSEAILAVAEEEGAWVLALATHGLGGVTRWAFGSVADYVLRHARTPLLLVRAAGPATSFQHIMAPLDGSARAESILALLRETAVGTGARVSLVNVVEEPSVAALRPHLRERREAHMGEMRTYLEKTAAGLRAAGVTVAIDVLSDRSAAGALLAWEQDHAVDLVAVTTHGRSGLARAAFGSVADRLVRQGTSPVLVQRVDTA